MVAGHRVLDIPAQSKTLLLLFVLIATGKYALMQPQHYSYFKLHSITLVCTDGLSITLPKFLFHHGR
jgi:hypothetical protein